MRACHLFRGLAVLAMLAMLVACAGGRPGATTSGGGSAGATSTKGRVPTFTPLPSRTPKANPTATPVPSPTATQTPTPAAPSGPATIIVNNSSLVYQPEFPAVTPAIEAPPVPAGVNPLTGLAATNPALLQRRPFMVRFGNDPVARPPTAISQAEVVFEDLMEARWVTRLSAIFWEADPVEVGPIRSARPVNIELAPMFDAVLLYSGASIGTSQALAQQPLNLINEGQGKLFFRSGGRAAPHNLHSSLVKAREWIATQGWERPVTVRGWTFASTPPTGTITATERVEIPYPATSTVAWSWDAAAGVYRRWVQGMAYTDAVTNQQVGCENVVILYARHWDTDIIEDSNGARAVGIALRGGGRVQVLRDGRLIEATWWRRDANWLPQFIDAQGQPIPLKPGRTWVQIVPSEYQVVVR